MDNHVTFCTVSIQDLKGKKFNVPDYQRGYRWEEEEIEYLLSDLLECNANSGKKYCLQPLVVKYNKDSEKYDLIDGQQRLTTIYILTQLAKYERNRKEDNLIIDYSIEFEIRTESKDFLENIATCQPDSRNPDFYYISKAKECIKNYASEKKMDIARIYEIFADKAQFIWYCIDEKANSVEMFQKLNVGKINLKDAELVKAVLLTKENHYTNEEKEKLGWERLAPIIANRLSAKAREWDHIEQSLANDDFWYFIADDDFKDQNPRISIILDAVAKDLPGGAAGRSAFNVIYDDVKGNHDAGKNNRVEEIWERISAKHALFSEWFNDDELYHLIGFLVRARLKTVREISQKTNNMRKSEIVNWLKNEIKKWSYFYKDKTEKKDLSDIDYNDNKSDLRHFFLLFNVLTILRTLYSEKDKNSKTILRFPFEKYEKQKWDIEHIHAKADSNLELNDENENALRNLTLLDSYTNREYKNKPFDIKRDFIRDKIKTDRFVPICTQNVFFKVYTSYADKINNEGKNEPVMAGWTEKDFLEYKHIRREFDEKALVTEYRDYMNRWNEQDWFFYEKEIEEVIFNGFINKQED